MPTMDTLTPAPSPSPAKYPPEEINTLATKHSHPRDSNIEFDPVPHIYTVNKDPTIKYTSVTTWNHSHFEHFDADAIITKIFTGKNWNPTNKYWGKTRDEIKQMWDQNRDEAAEAGTEMHYRIECFHNMSVPNNPKPNYHDLYEYYRQTYAPNMSPTMEEIKTELSTEWYYFLNYVRDHPTFVPYRTEWMIYHEELQISGSVDMVYELPTGELAIYDWKRAREIVQNERFGKRATTKCIRHFPDTNYWHYTLQLNIYKMILEQKYQKQVAELCLVVLHPNNFCSNYLLYPVPIITKEVNALYQYRLHELAVQKQQLQLSEQDESNVESENEDLNLEQI